MDSPKSVIFLDIDGVLNSVQSSIGVGAKSYDYEGLDLTGIGLLKKLCALTGAKIVISSTWRFDGHEAIAGAFAARGWRDVIFKDTVIGVTPDLPGVRGDEIQKWLEDNPWCKNYVILDDDADMLDTQKDHFVHTDNVIGFHLYDMVKAMDILGVPADKKNEADGVRSVVTHKLEKRAGGKSDYTI